MLATYAVDEHESGSGSDVLLTVRRREEVFDRAMRAITLENEVLSATVLMDKGADIYRLVHRRSGIDVLWKAPWGPREPGQSCFFWLRALFYDAKSGYAVRGSTRTAR